MEKLTLAATKSFRSLSTPGMTAIFIKSIIITIAFLVVLVVAITYGSTQLAYLWQDWRFASYVPLAAGIFALFMAWLIFPAIMPLIVAFFDESIINNIETHEYGGNHNRIKVQMMQEIIHDLGFAAKAIFLNIIVLPFYLIPGINLFVFYVLNGYLLGNEFYLAVARRHLVLREAKTNRKRNAQAVFFGGIALTFLFTIPLVNILAPFWAIALMTHLFHINNPDLKPVVDVR